MGGGRSGGSGMEVDHDHDQFIIKDDQLSILVDYFVADG
jgi:hypothetical protein